MFVNSHPVPNGTNNKIIERYITQMRGVKVKVRVKVSPTGR